MNSFILKGNICYSISKTKLKTLSGYVVCKDGKCAGVFEKFPDNYKDLELRDLKDRLIIPGMAWYFRYKDRSYEVCKCRT